MDTGHQGEPGFTFVAILRFRQGESGRDRYVIQQEIDAPSGALGVLIDAHDRLALEWGALRIAADDYQVPWGTVLPVIAQIGTSGTHWAVQLLIGDRILAETVVPGPEFDPTALGVFTMGARRDEKMGGVFDMFEQMVFSRALAPDERRRLWWSRLKEVQQGRGAHVAFDGGQSLHSDKRLGGAPS